MRAGAFALLDFGAALPAGRFGSDFSGAGLPAATGGFDLGAGFAGVADFGAGLAAGFAAAVEVLLRDAVLPPDIAVRVALLLRSFCEDMCAKPLN